MIKNGKAQSYGVYFCLGQLYIFETEEERPGYIRIGTITVDYVPYYTPDKLLEQFNHDNLVRLQSLRRHVIAEMRNLRGFRDEIDKSIGEIAYNRQVNLTGAALRKARRFEDILKTLDDEPTENED